MAVNVSVVEADLTRHKLDASYCARLKSSTKTNSIDPIYILHFVVYPAIFITKGNLNNSEPQPHSEQISRARVETLGNSSTGWKSERTHGGLPEVCERDYTERYSASISSANETGEKCCIREAMEGQKEELSRARCIRIRFNAQGTQCAEWIILLQSQISLYRPNSAATTSAATTPRARALSRGRAFIPSGSRAREASSLAGMLLRAFARTRRVIHIADERIKETCWRGTRHHVIMPGVLGCEPKTVGCTNLMCRY